jgi:DNA-binding LacI/PurR family transcriptional regulator
MRLLFVAAIDGDDVKAVFQKARRDAPPEQAKTDNAHALAHGMRHIFGQRLQGNMEACLACPGSNLNAKLLVTSRNQMKAKAPQPHALPQRISLVDQTAQSLREGIRSGYWQKQLPGERELCSNLQISRRTLRAALDELQRTGWLEVSQRRRRRIKTRRVNRSSMAQRKVIAVLSACSHAAMSSLMMFVLDVLREKLAKAGYDIKLHVNAACFLARPAQALDTLVQRHPAAAWLILGSKEPMQCWFIQRRLPCLVVGSCAPRIDLPSVDSDHRAACLHAGGVLLRKGHRRIALVLPRDAYGGDLMSEEGLREALATSSANAELRVLRHDGTTTHLCSLLDHALRTPNSPTAFVVARPLPALTVMMHLLRRGRRIPQDVAVIAREDDRFLQASTPSVAHYADNPEHFARRLSLAVRRLAESGSLPAHPIRLIPSFVPGGSI